MEEQRIEFETAKLAYDKGLRRRGELIKEGQTLKINLDGIKCNTCFNLQGNPTTPKYVHNDQQYVRPTQTLLQKWLIEKHNILVLVDFDKNKDGKGIMYTTNWQPIEELHKGGYSDEQYNTYEQALEVGLIQGLKLIQNK